MNIPVHVTRNEVRSIGDLLRRVKSKQIQFVPSNTQMSKKTATSYIEYILMACPVPAIMVIVLHVILGRNRMTE